MKIRSLLVSLLILLLAGAPLLHAPIRVNAAQLATIAVVHTVCATGADFTSIQVAIDAATPGDTVSICEGTFLENLTVNKNLTLQGAGKEKTIIDGQRLNAVIVISEGTVATVSNLSIRNGLVFSPLDFPNGGAGVRNYGALTLVDCNVDGNEAFYGSPPHLGGGILNIGTMEVRQCTIRNNRSEEGGGISNRGVMRITQSTIAGNVSSNSHGGIPFAVGGGIANSGQMTITDSTIDNNHAQSDGGGIANTGALLMTNSQVTTNNARLAGGIHNSSNGNLTLANSTIVENQAFSSAGISNHGDFSIENSRVTSNTATYGKICFDVGCFFAGGYAGGIENYGTLKLTNTTVSGNSALADENGGDNTQFGGGLWNAGTTTSLHSTFIENKADDNGGGIFNSGILTLNSTAVNGNKVPEGGSGAGIFNKGTLMVDLSTIADNGPTAAFDPTLDAQGGGIHNEGNATVTNTIIRNNSSMHGNGGRAGGGIWNNGLLTVVTSTVESNVGGNGAGIFNTSGGNVTIHSSIIKGNAPSGGIFNGGQLEIVNSTVSKNEGNYAGGLYNVGGTLLIRNTTIAENLNSGFDPAIGAVSNYVSSGGAVKLINSLVVNNTATGDCAGTITSLGHNLDSDGTCNLTATGDLPNRNPMLGPLADNGGPTLTYALLTASPAIDSGDNTACPTTDQRGGIRPQGAACDIGAFELEQVSPGTLIGKCAGHPVYEKNGTYSSPGWSGAIKVGDKRNNTLNGTDNADLILGMSGNDLINGKGGNDIICGGDGVDFLLGESGDDVLDGGLGNDVLNGGSGDYDELYAYDGNDALLDGDGVSVASAGAGNDDLVIVLRNGWRNPDGTTLFSGLTAGYGNDKTALAILENTPFVLNISGDEYDDPVAAQEGKNDKLALLVNVAPASNIVKFENIYTPRSDEVAVPDEESGGEYLTEPVGEAGNQAIYLPLLTR